MNPLARILARLSELEAGREDGPILRRINARIDRGTKKARPIPDIPFDVAEWGDRPRLLDVAEKCCPRCNSCHPHLHPAVQYGGEVQPCPHDFHRQITSQNTKQRIAEVDAILARINADKP